MKKRAIVPSLAAAAEPPKQIQVSDVQNLIFAARRALPALAAVDLINVSASIQRLEAVVAAAVPAAKAAPEAAKK
jgi:hypothetical protein